MDGNVYAETRGAGPAAKSLKLEGNQERTDPESVSKVEGVVVTGTKAAGLIGSACGALRRS
jgi:hypothetical protein